MIARNHITQTLLLVIVLYTPSVVTAQSSTNADIGTILAQWHYPQYGWAVPRRIERPRASTSRILRGVLNLLQKNYVDDISVKHELQRTLDELTFTLLPHCVEAIIPIDKCNSSPRTCFMKSLRGITRNCELNDRTLFYIALKILMRGLDPYSELMDAEMFNELKVSTSGKFGGIGAVVSPRHGDYRVISCLDGQPAQNAGIQPGDVIEAVDGISIHGLVLLDVLRKVRGSVGSRIVLTIRGRKSRELREIQLRRKLIKIDAVKEPVTMDGISYIRIVNFQINTARNMRKAIRKILSTQQSPLRGIILDLRNNPGGLIDQAIAVADMFLDDSTITELRGRGPEMNRVFKAKPGSTKTLVPIVVLINRGTASAAEILAGALKGRSGVIVMGERSFGKASVQGVFPLPNGMAIRLTTAHYFTPDGQNIEKRGIVPDIIAKDHPKEFLTPKSYLAMKQRPREDPLVDKAYQELSATLAVSGPPFSNLY